MTQSEENDEISLQTKPNSFKLDAFERRLKVLPVHMTLRPVPIRTGTEKLSGIVKLERKQRKIY